jgi:hypothetical protein
MFVFFKLIRIGLFLSSRSNRGVCLSECATVLQLGLLRNLSVQLWVLFIILRWRSFSAGMAESDFLAKGLFQQFRWTAVDKKTLRQGQAAAKQLIRDGGTRNIDLAGISFDPDGIVFPFKAAVAFRTAYACISRSFKPKLDEAGVHKDKWGFKVIGESVGTKPAAMKHEGTDPEAMTEEVADPKVEGTNPKVEVTDPKVEGTDSIIWPPSVPLKLTRGTQCDKVVACGLGGPYLD